MVVRYSSRTGTPAVQLNVDPVPVAFTSTPAGLGTGGGTTVATKQQYGSLAHIVIQFTKDASAGTGTADVTFTLPPGLTQAAGGPMINGSGEYRNTAGNYIPCNSLCIGGLIYLRIGTNQNLRGQDLAATSGIVYIDIWVPITEYVQTAYVTSTTGLATSARAGLLNYYEEGVANLSVTGAFAASFNVSYCRVGKMVTLQFPSLFVAATVTTNLALVLTNLPASMRPVALIDFIGFDTVNSGADTGTGFLRLPTSGNGSIGKAVASQNFTSGGNAGWSGFAMSYIAG